MLFLKTMIKWVCAVWTRIMFFAPLVLSGILRFRLWGFCLKMYRWAASLIVKWKTTYATPSSQPMEQTTALKPSYSILWYSSYCTQSYLSDIYNYPIQSLPCSRQRHSWRMACLRAQCWGLFSSFCTLYLSPISLPAILYHRSHTSRNKQLAMKRTILSKNSNHVHNMFLSHIMT